MKSQEGESSSVELVVQDAQREYVNLLKIPKDVIFPLELSIHLKERLQAALEEIFQLKKQLFNQDYETNYSYLQAEKSRSETYFQTRESSREIMSSSSSTNTQMATKVVELSKRIRDLTAEQESMKTRMKQLMAENEHLKKREARAEAKSEPLTDAEEESKKLKGEKDNLLTVQQLANTTQKMMDYRRQTQQLRMELRTALKALCQEVGDGTTPQTVLATVTSNTWRGRQQQILTLQQRNAELTARLNQVAHPSVAAPHAGGGEPYNGGSDIQSLYDDVCSEAQCSSEATDDKSIKTSASLHSSVSNNTLQPCSNRKALAQQERNKHELLEKTTRELEATRKELRSTLMSMKAVKARVATLEDQVKSYRAQVEGLEGKLAGKQIELEEANNEIQRLVNELSIIKDRMATIRDNAAGEIKEVYQQLITEKSTTSKLQKKVESYEGRISELQNEIQELQLSLSAFKTLPPDEMDTRKRLQAMEHQFEAMKEGLRISENECRRMVCLVEESVERAEEERGLHSETQRHLIKSLAVIEHAEQIINLCLDAGNINDKKILETIEDLRCMRRELKTGDLFHLQIINTVDVRKLKSRINILGKEVALLQKSLKQSAMERKRDLQNFAAVVEKSREEFLAALSNSIAARSFQLKSLSSVNATPACEATS